MKNWLKVLLITFGVIILVLLATIFLLNEKRPAGIEGPEAEEMADKMFSAVNKPAWDSLKILTWDFPRGHQYVWDQSRNLVEVRWGGNKTILDLSTMEGRAWRDQTELGGSDGKTVILKSIHFFYNDSFWLQAFNKVRDPGTSRAVVEYEDGRKGLLVTYSSGGITPGDAYLWFLDENGLPLSWKMWVKIIPVGGLEFKWENWLVLPGGAKVASDHTGSVFSVNLKNIKGGMNLEDLGLPANYFEKAGY